jgi:5-methylcytosine-specific restriction endonuclease McrBC GTP-binding regulatory subunit McrB
MLKADQFPFSSTYKNKLEYKSLESKVDKSILSKEKYYISGHDVIYFYDYPKSNNLNLDF